MPTYEYECQVCSHRFEQFQSMSAKPLEVCPTCQGKVKRLIGAGAGLIFKGTGFYKTDYRSSSDQKKAEADKKPSAPASPSPKNDSATAKSNSPSSKE